MFAAVAAMSSDFSPELRQELLDDFYAECDELLTSMRDGLVLLEPASAQSAPKPAAIESLFRSLHSLKGIAAIVGLRPAELLAHAMEDVLRALSKHSVALTPAIVQLLLISTLRLEQVVTAHRLGKSIPETAELQEKLRQIGGGGSAAERTKPHEPSDQIESSEPADPIQSARDRGLQIWTCSFTPAPELDHRGINVNVVRERLGALGEIVKATPSVRGKGLIVFEFIVALSAPPPDQASWANDGLHFAPFAPPPAPASAAKPALTESDFTDALSLTPSHIVRVDLARLDDLMRITGEMVIHRSRLEDRLSQAGVGSTVGSTGLKEISVALGRSLREMREAISRVRLVPVAEIFTRMQFVVSDLVRDSGKQVRIALEGHQTEVDKYLVEHLKEPLLHLVRNAVAHGIETTDARIAAGKPAEATIRLRAMSVGEFVKIQISDDGRGMDAAAIRARAVKLGIPVPERSDATTLLEVLCAPGFSTREEADLIAGRGVGMAVVANAVRRLGGSVSLESTLGQGTEFTLRLPLNLSIADAIIVSVGGQICAVPQSSIDEIVQVPAEEVRTIKATEVIPYRGGLLPFLRLSTFFKVPVAVSPTLTLLVVSAEHGKSGVAVERIHAQREIVIRPLSDPLLRVPGISGATELGDGRPILILDAIALTNGVVCPPSADTDLQLRAS